MEESSSAEIEHRNRDQLEIEIQQMLAEPYGPPIPLDLLPEFFIYRVPNDIRELNENAYTPKYISIGPFHHFDERLKTMEKLKVKYFQKFVKKAKLQKFGEKAKLSVETLVNDVSDMEAKVETLVNNVSDMEAKVRSYYTEPSELDSNGYVKMILLDASFIIVFFLICFMPREWENDDKFTISTSQVMDDMMLLENQLPFFVIEKLYDLTFSSRPNYPSFTQLAFKFFKRYNTQNMSPDFNLKIKHFVDLLRTFFLPTHMLPQRDNGKRVTHLYTASQLHEAGVKFKVSSSKCGCDLKFTNGVLEIPCFHLNYSTERFFRNIMTLEQFCYCSDHYVSDYVRILDFLIDTSKDVDLLVRKRILDNTLSDSNAVTTMVNNLNKGTFYFNTNSDYYRLCKELKKFYKKPWQSRKATLRRDYCSNLWRTIATIAAIILLGLTLTQTICSILSVPKN
jgi:hypothetical protein